MSIPDYMMTAPPRLEHIKVNKAEAQERAGTTSSSLIPRSMYEFGGSIIGAYGALCVGMGLGARRVRPMYTGIWKLPIGYVLGLYGLRWCENGNGRLLNYYDNMVEDYMKLYPEKFPQQKPKKVIETFCHWVPVRAGGSQKRSEFLSMGKKPHTDHYIPSADHKMLGP